MTVKKKPTAAQLKARKLFAERAKAGTLRKNPIKKKAAVKKNPAKKKAVKKVAPNPIKKTVKRAPKAAVKNPVKRRVQRSVKSKGIEVQKHSANGWKCIASFPSSADGKKDALAYARAYHKAHNATVRVES